MNLGFVYSGTHCTIPTLKPLLCQKCSLKNKNHGNKGCEGMLYAKGNDIANLRGCQLIERANHSLWFTVNDD